MWTRAYTIFAGTILFVQGASTLTALLVPAFDAAFPFVLDATRMVPIHSSLHLVTAALAFAALATRRRWLFAIGFGVFYTGLALAGWITGASLCLSLQPFDHPFHLVLGGLGIAAALLESSRPRPQEAKQ